MILFVGLPDWLKPVCLYGQLADRKAAPYGRSSVRWCFGYPIAASVGDYGVREDT